jgi:hypothetical protein
VTNLPVKPGIDGIPTGLIPTDPAAFVDWFKNSFLPRWAANADARNAIATSSSVQITGDTNTPAGIGIGPNSITNGELVKRSPLSVMGNPTGISADVQDIVAGADGQVLTRTGGQLVFAPSVPSITTADSITGTGAPATPLELVGDAASPGNTQYYGTDGTGTRGFFPVPVISITTIVQSGGASQVYNIPSGAHVIEVIEHAGGGGGGSGNKGATPAGGGGGGGGGISWAKFRAADLGASITVTFSNAATGGNPGANVGAVGAGNTGTAGSNVSFGGRLTAIGGQPGNGAAAAAGGAGGSAGVGNWQGATNGGSGTTGIGSAGSNLSNIPVTTGNYGNTGGGGGSGAGANPGSLGGGSTGASFITLLGGTAGVANGGAITGAGGPGANGTGLQPSSGGGGGSTGTVASINAGPGGAGGTPGGGGGGGGGIVNTAAGNSGAGGQGGPAWCIVIAY